MFKALVTAKGGWTLGNTTVFDLREILASEQRTIYKQFSLTWRRNVGIWSERTDRIWFSLVVNQKGMWKALIAATCRELKMIVLSEEVRQRKTNIIYYSYVEYNFKNWDTWIYLQNRNRLTDIKNKLLVTKGETWQGEINQELGVNIHTLLHINR